MNHPNLYFSAPGFTSTTKQITPDGILTCNIKSSGNSASRMIVSLTAERLGLEEGKTYTIKVWATDNDFSTSRDSQIYTNNSYQSYHQSSPISKTWVQSGGYGVQVGNLFWENYAANTLCGICVMVVEGDHIDDYVPYT